MRQFLISAAAVALLAVPCAWADPPADRGNRGEGQHDQGGGHDRGNRGGGPAPQAAPQAAQAPANRGGENRSFGHPQAMQAPANPPAPQASAQAPQNRGDENRNFGRGERGFDRGGRDRGQAPQMANQAPQDRGGDNRGFDRRGPDNRNSFNDNRGGDNRGFDRNRNAFNDNRGGDFNRDGRTSYRSPGFGGQRHNFTGFRDYHRDFRAQHRFQVPYYRRPAGWYSHRWAFGEFLPAAFWVRDYWLIDFADYDLPPPPYGAVWVRVDRDALLIDEDSGEIITVVYDVFY